MTLPQDRMIMPAPVPSHPSAQRPPASIGSIRSQSVPTLLRPTGQYQFVVPPRISQTPPPSKNVSTKDEIKAAIASIDHVLIAALGNPKDRPTLTKLETDVQNFLRNPQMTRLDFPPMSSYQRLMAHRIAEYYHMEHTAVDLDTSRRAVVLFKTAGSHCPTVPLCNIPEEAAALASGKSPVNNTGKIPSPGVVLQDTVDLSFVNPEEVPSSCEFKEVFEENSSYEPDPDMPPLTSSEPPKQFKLLRRKPSPSPDGQKGIGDSSTSDSKANSEKTLEEREKDYALARARIFNHENLDGGAAELAGLTMEDPSLSSPPRSDHSQNQNENSHNRLDQSPERGSSPVNSNYSRFSGRNNGNLLVNGSLSRAHSSGTTQYYNNNLRNRGSGPNYGVGSPSPASTQPFNSYGPPFHWGVTGGRGSPNQQQHAMFQPVLTEAGDWFPVYTSPDNPYNYPPYFQPQSRQGVPLFIPPNGTHSGSIPPPEHSFPQETLPMMPGQQPCSRGYGPNQKGKFPQTPTCPSGRSDKSFTLPRRDSSPRTLQHPSPTSNQLQRQNLSPKVHQGLASSD